MKKTDIFNLIFIIFSFVIIVYLIYIIFILISKIKYKVYRNKMFLCSPNISYFVNIGKMIIKTIDSILKDLRFYNIRINLLLYTTNNIDHIEDLYNRCVSEYKICKEYIETLYAYEILKRRIKIKKAKISKKKLETIYE